MTTPKEFGNWFAYAYSAWGAYRECPRRWWLSKVLFWRGWEQKADPDSRLAYQLTKMSNCASLAGNCLHEIFSDQVRRDPERTLEQALARFEYMMQRGWNQSLSGKWRERPKHVVCLHEHYYRSPWAEKNFDQARENGRVSIANFFELTLLKKIRASKIACVEELEQVEIEGVDVWVKVDLEISRPDDVVVIIDWKGGKERPEHRAQAAIYALSRVARGIPREKIWVALAYVQEPRVEYLQFTEENLDAARMLIREGAAELRSLLTPPGDKNLGPKSNFPMTEDEYLCRYCDMFHVCKGTRVVPGVTKA